VTECELEEMIRVIKSYSDFDEDKEHFLHTSTAGIYNWLYDSMLYATGTS
jgi:hypothetical protein